VRGVINICIIGDRNICDTIHQTQITSDYVTAFLTLYTFICFLILYVCRDDIVCVVCMLLLFVDVRTWCICAFVKLCCIHCDCISICWGVHRHCNLHQLPRNP